MSESADILAALCRQIETRKRTDTGLLARLRRGNPGIHDGRDTLFETQTLLLAAGVDPAPGQYAAWALIVHCLALTGGAHRGGLATGELLAQMKFSELRMRMLLEADEALLRDLLPRLARRVASQGMTLNWWPFANLLGLGTKYTPDEARRELIRGYLHGSAAKD